ncbi:MAG: hypothetical protein ACR2KC_03465 [Acidimicrobiales bacterium]
MSAAHKKALAAGREEGRAVRRYLEALESHRPKRGRKRTPQSIQNRLSQISARIAEADALSKLRLVQEKMDLEAELATKSDTNDLSELEEDFVRTAAAYSQRKGISYAAWRQAGVSAEVLRRAGVQRRS